MEKPLREHYEVETDAGEALATFKYIEDLEKYIDFIESKFAEKHIKIDELRNTRKSLGITLREMESEIGISNAYLSQLETGKITNPSFRVVDTLNRYFHTKKLNGFNNGRDTTEGVGGKEAPLEEVSQQNGDNRRHCEHWEFHDCDCKTNKCKIDSSKLIFKLKG